MVRHYLVKGRVQGVGFRWFVHREAGAFGLHGWVRNTEDGHVEVVASGDRRIWGLLLEALHKGSRGSRVDAVVEHESGGQRSRGTWVISDRWRVVKSGVARVVRISGLKER